MLVGDQLSFCQQKNHNYYNLQNFIMVKLINNDIFLIAFKELYIFTIWKPLADNLWTIVTCIYVVLCY